jgi:eukaryotic-like serine/threonine-protein kinase
MATVHLARARGAGGFERLVAIKALHPHIASEPEFVAMFLDEARLAASIRHPNVVATIDVQEDPLFLVMDYVEGPSLHLVQRELRKRGTFMPLEVTLRVLHDTLAGLHAAHELRAADGARLELIHRDVSPHNVLLGLDGITRITDFGVARASSRLSSTRGGQVKGKIKYMAPEQVAAEELDRRVDLYAAGIVLWEMLTNEHLYQGDSDAAVLAQIVMGKPRHPRQLVPTIPEAIDAVCMRALAPKRDARFATAADSPMRSRRRRAPRACRSPPVEPSPTSCVSSTSTSPHLRPAASPLDASSPSSISAKQSGSGPTGARAEHERPDPQHSTSAGTLVAIMPRRALELQAAHAPRLVAGVLVLGVGLGVALYSVNSKKPARPGASSSAAATPASAPSPHCPAERRTRTVSSAVLPSAAAIGRTSASAHGLCSHTGVERRRRRAALPTRPHRPPARPRSTAFRPGDL